jgi:hypothetical protein
LGNINLLGTDISWIEELLVSYHLSSTFVREYILAYFQAAKIHLGESAKMIVDWLERLVSG